MTKKSSMYAVKIAQEGGVSYLVGSFGQTTNKALASKYNQEHALKRARKLGEGAGIIPYKALIADISPKQRLKCKLVWVERYLQRARTVLLDAGIESTYNISRNNVPYIRFKVEKLGVVTVSYFMKSLFFRAFHSAKEGGSKQFRMDFATPQDLVSYINDEKVTI